MKVIFLDIDGVLNCAYTKETYRGLTGLDSAMVVRLHDILAKTGASLVLSAACRKMRDWRDYLSAGGLNVRAIVGRTPGLASGNRGEEIQAWLAAHPEVEKFAILDDDYHFSPDQPLFQTSWYCGLTQEVADKIICWLGTKS